MSIEVKPDIYFTPNTEEEADKANNLYNLLVRAKEQTHRENEKEAKMKIKRKQYTPNNFLKDMLFDAMSEIDGKEGR
ncbi:conserved hypothetical protein [Vibrio crassostreae]|uniref:hypothetical protein n=1 Tax=Vibrio crassostreae TaxID=246167 RepID=UPI000F479768|nr:hypothetical protein [Vibrio crassostreae]ROO64257.1 hypothetical protein EDB58_102138 [Vibrio crassostreae]CAK1876434.1 conserved hypothetical protein [Vibrio crassostreae]CAK2061679.1 conserved hypothetical protein [Vibrio crassostreae]CAK2857899.1 conserved hypothetical protein [Vibrio crassostreae]CAK3233572.1 conserved hypothetical protein [Vibrio crassostreae]